MFSRIGVIGQRAAIAATSKSLRHASTSARHCGLGAQQRAIPRSIFALMVALPLATCTASSTSCYWWPFAGTKAANRTQGHTITLYQYDPCPFCNKVRAVLDYHKLPYTVVEVNPMRKKELAFSKDYKKVPICVIDGEVFNDSTDIVDKIHDVVASDGGRAAARSADEPRWREWLNTRLIKLYSPNIYRTPAEALQAFDYITAESNFTYTEQVAARYFGAAVMYLIGRRNAWKMGIKDERQALVEAVDEWIDDGVGNKPFHGGKSPNLMDLEIFGVLRALEGMRSTRDDLFSQSRVGPWYQRMKDAVGAASRINEKNVHTESNDRAAAAGVVAA